MKFFRVAFTFAVGGMVLLTPYAKSQDSPGGKSATGNSISLRQDARPIKYDRMLFGQFVEHFHRQVYGGIFEPGSKLSDADGYRKDVIGALRELNVPIVRWPGGCFVSAYHWLGGVGPKRVPAYDKAWKVEEPNTFGTAEYVKWCRKIGAEPYICTNAGTGTSEEMSDWVEYCNLNVGKYGRMRRENGDPEPYNVMFWSVGNENWGGHEIGARTVGEWGPLVRESSKMMRAVTPGLKLFAAALSDKNWTLPLLKEAGYMLDFVSIHGYWDPLWVVNNPSPYLDCMMRTGQPEEMIRQTIAILDESGFRGKVKIAFDEWNLRGWHHPDLGDLRKPMDIAARDKNDINATYTMADALFSACFLNSCLRHAEDVQIACFAPVVNARGLLYVHPGGIVKRTTYHVFDMYVNRLEEYVLPVTFASDSLRQGIQSTPILDVVLTTNKSKTKFVYAIVNKDPGKSVQFDPGFEGIGVKTPNHLSATMLSGTSENDYNDVGFPERVVQVQTVIKVVDGRIAVPPHSLVVIEVNHGR
jgi:alpha-L-arabinofuranosidase